MSQRNSHKIRCNVVPRCLQCLPTRSYSVDDGFEAIVCLLHIKVEIMSLFFGEFLTGFHLVQGDEPLYDLATMLEVLVGDFVDRLDHVRQKWMKCRFGDIIQSQCIKEGDEILCCGKDESSRRCSGLWWTRRYISRCIDFVCGQAYTQSFLCSWAFHLLSQYVTFSWHFHDLRPIFDRRCQGQRTPSTRFHRSKWICIA